MHTGWKSRGRGSSDFCQKTWEVPYFGPYCIFINKYCPMFTPAFPPHPRVHLWIMSTKCMITLNVITLNGPLNCIRKNSFVSDVSGKHRCLQFIKNQSSKRSGWTEPKPKRRSNLKEKFLASHRINSVRSLNLRWRPVLVFKGYFSSFLFFSLRLVRPEFVISCWF